MKPSKYNLVVPYSDKFIHYNMITKSILLSDCAHPNSQFSEFLENGFFVDDSFDEIKESELLWSNERDNRNHLLLTVIPTLRCNLDCTYCYQHELHNNMETAGYEILNGILSHITKSSELNSVHIEWTGGEPLLEINLIRDFSASILKLCEERGIKYTSSLSTNGYLLTSDNITGLISSNITTINTTLAGTASLHDSLRKVRGSSHGSFKEVWNNIISATQVLPVSICINVTADAETEIRNLIDQIADINNDNLSISFLLVEDYGYGEKSIFLSKEHHFPVMLQLLEYALDKGLRAEVNSNFGCKHLFCATQMSNSYIIHPSGRIYKCANSYCIENSIGTVSENGFIFSKRQFFSSPYADEKCSSCDILPYCNGGCQFARESKKDYCPHEKDYLHDLLRLYVKSLTLKT